MKLGIPLSALVAAALVIASVNASSVRAAPDDTSTNAIDQTMLDAIKGQTLNIPEIGRRSLQSLDDFDTVRLGDDTATVTVTIDQTAANGAATYGDKIVVIRPAVAGLNTKVTCTGTLAASLVTMQFFMRKAVEPDKDDNGEAKDYDCAAMDDNDFLSPDVESCTVTNFNEVGDVVVAYVAVLDRAFNKGATYSISFICNAEYPNDGWGCFSKDATVDVLGKGTTSMQDVRIGDQLYTGESYEPVYAFAHLDKSTRATYLQILTNSQKTPLEVTEDHLLLVNDKYVSAREVKVGDTLMDAAHNRALVKEITTTEKIGLYAPLTPSGTLVVNGVHTSAYVSLLPEMKDTLKLGSVDTHLSFHFINHIALSPIRMACMGISSSFCSMEHISEESNGYAPFVNFWFQLVQLYSPQALPVQVFLLALFFCMVGPLYALELLLGARSAPALILVGLLLGHVYTKKTHSKKVKTL